MTDLDDLIRNRHGDVKKLREIRDTIRHDNFITAVDKKYIESLISTYLRNQSLDETEIHVDHFIPWSYIFEDEAWNLVLACRKCNLRKSDSLTNLDFCNELIKRNINHYKEIENLRISLLKLHVNQDKWEQEIKHHYTICKEYGFSVVNLP